VIETRLRHPREVRAHRQLGVEPSLALIAAHPLAPDLRRQSLA